MGFLDRLLGRRPATKIADVVEGASVRITGTVACAAPLAAPYTGRACAYWRLEMIQQQFGRVATLTALDATDFTIDDGSGRAQVLVEACEIDVVSNYVEMERARLLSDKAKALAAQYEWGPFEDVAQVNVREAIIAIGDDIDVEGIATREPAAQTDGAERGYRDAASVLIFSTGTRVIGKQREAVLIKP